MREEEPSDVTGILATSQEVDMHIRRGKTSGHDPEHTTRSETPFDVEKSDPVRFLHIKVICTRS